MKLPYPAAGLVGTGLAAAVFVNAVSMNAYCLRHPLSMSCDDPQALKPELPDESPQPGPTYILMSPTASATSSTTWGTSSTLIWR
jgi:hypothetical protein